ncbi:alpha/beta hydrolase, partial [Dermatophilus congolensis]
ALGIVTAPHGTHILWEHKQSTPITNPDPTLTQELATAGHEIPPGFGIAQIPIPPQACVTYRLSNNDGPPSADPLNHDATGELGSLLTHPTAPRDGTAGLDRWPPRSPLHICPHPADRLRLDRNVLGRRCTLRIFTSGQLTKTTPVLFLLDGDHWLHLHDAPSALTTAVTDGLLPPHVLVLIPSPADPQARTDFLTSPTLTSALPGPILTMCDTWLSQHGSQRTHTVIAGQSLGALAATRAAATTTQFDALLGQSPAFWWTDTNPTDPLNAPPGGDTARHLPDLHNMRIRFTVGEDEKAMHPHVNAVTKALTEANIDVLTRTVPGGHDHACWRTTLFEELVTLWT